MSDESTLCEVFHSIQGESTRAGRPCVMIRLSGCNLRCRWCDTQYAWSGGEVVSVDDLMARVAGFGCRLVEVTGGEPLVQPAVTGLLRRLCDAGHETLLETNGSWDISVVDPRVGRIVDFKCPSSGEHEQTRWSNAAMLGPNDEAKFVLADRADYDYASRVLEDRRLAERCPVTFSPVHGRLAPATLAEWIVAGGRDVRLGLQLHRILWPDKERGA